jgi:hypothetical protein
MISSNFPADLRLVESGLFRERSRCRLRDTSTRLIALAWLILLGLVAPCEAGTRISGVVTDALGQPLAGAKIELRNQNDAVVGTAKSDRSGRFNLMQATPGLFFCWLR